MKVPQTSPRGRVPLATPPDTDNAFLISTLQGKKPNENARGKSDSHRLLALSPTQTQPPSSAEPSGF